MAQLFYLVMPVGTHVVNSETIAAVIDNIEQLIPDLHQLRRRNVAFKNGILHSLPDIFTSPRYLTQTALSRLVVCMATTLVLPCPLKPLRTTALPSGLISSIIPS